MSVDMLVDALVEWRSSIGWLLFESRLCLDRYSLSVDSWPIVGLYFADRLLTINPLSAETDMRNKY